MCCDSSESQNPYESPKAPMGPNRVNRLTNRDYRSGPAVYIAFFLLIGVLLGGMVLGTIGIGVGLLILLLGAPFGGLFYRIRSRHWPLDPMAKTRRFGTALITFGVIFGFFGIMAGFQGPGLLITLFGLFISASLASGILISGDRRRVYTDAPHLSAEVSDLSEHVLHWKTKSPPDDG